MTMATTTSSPIPLPKLRFPCPTHSYASKTSNWRPKPPPSLLPVTNDFSSSSHTSSSSIPLLPSSLRSTAFPVCYSSSSDLVQSSSLPLDAGDSPVVQLETSIWKWKGYSIRYQSAGKSGPALVLVHGFGANSDHWRKNIPVLAKTHRVYAIDLIGYGFSDKPNPRGFGDVSFYTFQTWATQLNDFCIEVVNDEAFYICNSIGGLVGLQAAVMEPQTCKGIVLLNISLRMLHIKKQPWFGRPFIRSFQNILRNTTLGKFFFNAVAKPESIKNILRQCYHDTTQVTDELVDKILQPGLEAGAADVFLEFICYSDGPLPEELLPQVKCPVLIGWGDKDPWEPIEQGRAYGNFDTVEEFVYLKDEAPHLVNPLVESFVARHSTSS
ncbi:Pheophytinase, chloroplastic [Linum perenne]